MAQQLQDSEFVFFYSYLNQNANHWLIFYLNSNFNYYYQCGVVSAMNQNDLNELERCYRENEPKMKNVIGYLKEKDSEINFENVTEEKTKSYERLFSAVLNFIYAQLKVHPLSCPTITAPSGRIYSNALIVEFDKKLICLDSSMDHDIFSICGLEEYLTISTNADIILLFEKYDLYSGFMQNHKKEIDNRFKNVIAIWTVGFASFHVLNLLYAFYKTASISNEQLPLFFVINDCNLGGFRIYHNIKYGGMRSLYRNLCLPIQNVFYTGLYFEDYNGIRKTKVFNEDITTFINSAFLDHNDEKYLKSWEEYEKTNGKSGFNGNMLPSNIIYNITKKRVIEKLTELGYVNDNIIEDNDVISTSANNIIAHENDINLKINSSSGFEVVAITKDGKKNIFTDCLASNYFNDSAGSESMNMKRFEVVAKKNDGKTSTISVNYDADVYSSFEFNMK